MQTGTAMSQASVKILAIPEAEGEGSMEQVPHRASEQRPPFQHHGFTKTMSDMFLAP